MSRRQPAWQAIRYFSLYRVVLAGLFAVLVVTGTLPSPLGDTDVRIFSITTIVYLFGALAALVAVETQFAPYRLQVYAQVALDVAAITLIMHSSGGPRSGLGILLVVSVAGASLLSSGRIAVLSAAVAALAVLAESAVMSSRLGAEVSFTQAGVLGASLFATAFIGYALAERVRVSEALAARQALDIASLSQLNEHIVQRMRSGVVVLDAVGRIVLMNASARHMLGVLDSGPEPQLATVAPHLDDLFRRWLQSGDNPTQPLESQSGGIEIIPSFTRLGAGAGTNTLVYLEDAAEMRQRAQQLKLASLGRLTASIAHEIRNPLSAISHAGQLLSESAAMSSADQRLTQIIAQHSQRMNSIIQNVLAIGRRETVVQESFDLIGWLHEFVGELIEHRGLDPGVVAFAPAPGRITVRIDRSQLHQIVWNLVENALRYSLRVPRVTFECGIFAGTERPYLEISDSGPGMTGEVAEQVFEPFFTSESSGTGLGLYIAREFAESNQASLSLIDFGSDGCRFRLLFAHPDRRQVSA